MKVEVLYFEGCPHYKPAVDLVRDVLREEQVSAEVLEIQVTDQETATAVGFLGSPSIRIEGLDVEPEARRARDFGITCRTYIVDGRREGLPSRDQIREAVRTVAGTVAQDRRESTQPKVASEEPNRSSFLMAGSLLAAVGASLCCTLPIVFALTGFSILGASAFFESLRPYLLVVTFGLLATGFHYAYRPVVPKTCAPGSVCAVPRRRQTMRAAMWVVTAVAVTLAAFPYYSGPVAEFVLSCGL
jgi:hypothetical protein